jgi:hypothetical protein
MKRQNGVVLSGKLADLRAAEVKAGDPATGSGPALTGVYTVATLITDHAAYGGHHCVLFPAEHAPDALAYWGLTDGNLEVTIEGWLRSMPAGNGGPPSAVVVADRVIYLTVTDAMRELVGRHKASARNGKFVGQRAAAQRAG